VLLFLAGRRQDDARDLLPPRIARMAVRTSRPLRCGIEVEHHEARSVSRPSVSRASSVVRQSNAKRPLLELHLDDAADVRFVVGDEHVARGRVGHGESMR
jgi:hypothetical protein